MFGISGEHIVILGIILLLFGPRRLPELGNTMGKAIRNFKDALAGVEEAKYRRVDEAPAKKPETLTDKHAQPESQVQTEKKPEETSQS